MEQVLRADGAGHGGLVGWVDLEGFRDAVDGDIDGVFVFGGEGAVCGGGGEEVADCEGEALFCVLFWATREELAAVRVGGDG